MAGIEAALDFCRSVMRVKDVQALLPLQEEAIAQQRELLQAQQSIFDLQRENAALRKKLADREQDPVEVIEGTAWTTMNGPFCPNCWHTKEERRLLNKRRNAHITTGATTSWTVTCPACEFRQSLPAGFTNPLADPEAHNT